MKRSIQQVLCTVIGLVSASGAFAYVPEGYSAKASSNTLLKTTAGCKPATAAIDLDINNVRSRVMTGGDMWWNQGTNTPSYEVPKGQGKHSLFAGSCWIGGIDGNGQLKVAAQLFRNNGQNDYWPGPIDNATKNITAASCSEWDRFWKVNASVVSEFRELYKNGGEAAIVGDKFDVIKQWPATGNIYAIGANNNALPEILSPVDEFGYAPFIDVNEDGIYNWKDGDYPQSYGIPGSNPDQFIWWVFNDVGNTKLQSKTESIGMEVQTSAFAYATSNFLNDATFFNYRLINRSDLNLDSCYIATWTDADLGYPFDDYVGCDTARGLGILYNAVTPDGANGQNSYGSRLPMIGVDFFIGPRKDYVDALGRDTFRLLKMTSFTYFNNTPVGPVRNPNSASDFYSYMTGSTATGIPFSNDQTCNNPSVGYGCGPVAPFIFYGDPGSQSEWSMCAAKVAPDDRRFIHSSGPFLLKPGAKNDITIGVVWVDNVGGCGNGNFKKIRAADDVAQAAYDLGFKLPVGPEAPLLKIREMDGRLIFYIVNPENSTNFSERFGDPKYASNPAYRSVSYKAKALNVADSMYRFEGYRVFQLRDSAAQIFDEYGNVTEDAYEVFQCDVKNGVSQITNYVKNVDVQSSFDRYNTIIKVQGADQGITHSFVLTDDAFATGQNQRLVNYKTYYYRAVAYGYNNFAEFDIDNEPSTQDEAYIESKNGPGNTKIANYAAMPHPMNERGDTLTNANYGDGVVITRIEGIGNGGNDVDLNDTTEAAILMSSTNSVPYPSYKAGKGPVSIKIVDPVKVVEANWRISLSGTMYPDSNRGLQDTATWKIERLDATGNVAQVIYSESDISRPNEQLLQEFGLSVTVSQVGAPGYDQVNGNGYITSDVTFQNTSLPWLTGVRDGSGRNYNNWIRSGSFEDVVEGDAPQPTCGPFNDHKGDTAGAFYSAMFANNTNVQSTWAPYDLVHASDANGCGFGPAVPGTVLPATTRMYYPSTLGGTIKFSEYPNVDLVFTSDRSKWTRCVVLEAQFNKLLAEGGATQFKPRNHRSWNGDLDAEGNPVYSSVAGDTGYSYFPGYAINQLTGERLNIVFTEDSYLKKFNGADMIWNPTTDLFNSFGETIFGGKHFTYILNTKYDSCKFFVQEITHSSSFRYIPAYRQIRWVGIPMLNEGSNYLSLRDGLIPTETRLRFRVNTPYKKYQLMPGQVPADRDVATDIRNPLYTFSTKGMGVTDYTAKTDAESLLDKVFAVPNPYKGQATGGNSYETNRLETKIKIINLPVKATINIYSLDGTLVRRLEKDNNDPYITWDLYNQAGLPIASGMYLIHVNAYGKDRVLRWFGAMRPLDVTNN